ncbi:GntR family transcriptional regulator [Clostridium cuniculi]|uniref:GntR family transcriptional regulator n=2 Tax=Clostridium TaxID=1485 RepID=UPI0018A885E4|nr:GntR family transcriptional regulator [Clostridium cuniculi]
MLKYQIIANEIENNIYSNDLPQGTKLPTVEALASEYKVSKSTIVKAVESLVSKGLVYQLQGSGIFVRRRNRNGYIDLNITQGFTTSLKEFNITSKVLEFNLIRADEEIAKLIECDVNDEAYFIKRVRYINDEIMCYEEAYYKKSIVPYLTEEIAKGSIFEYLQTALNLKPGFSDRYLHLEKLDNNLANILKLEPGDPAMVVLEQIYLPSGVSFNVSKLVYNYKNTQFFLQSSYVK